MQAGGGGGGTAGHRRYLYIHVILPIISSVCENCHPAPPAFQEQQISK